MVSLNCIPPSQWVSGEALCIADDPASPAVLLEAAQQHVEPRSLPTYEHQPEITPHATTQMEALGKEDEKVAFQSDDHQAAVVSATDVEGEVQPTEEESLTLRRIAAPIP